MTRQHVCTSCKCAQGCIVTVAVSNDGTTYSGRGANGESWMGSTTAFAFKDVVPTVQFVSLDLPGYRDSTRIYGPVTGQTRITVHGEQFQNTPLLRCFFATFGKSVRAEYISSSKVSCVTPNFISEEEGGQITGGGETSSSKVHVSGVVSVQIDSPYFPFSVNQIITLPFLFWTSRFKCTRVSVPLRPTLNSCASMERSSELPTDAPRVVCVCGFAGVKGYLTLHPSQAESFILNRAVGVIAVFCPAL